MRNRIGLLVIATGGERYTQYLWALLRSASKFFPPHIPIVFTDSREAWGAMQVLIPDLGWPKATLMRYHHFAHRQDFLKEFDYLFYVDVDMLMVGKIVEADICADGITATTHPGYPQTFERRPASRACVTGAHPYYQGCFVGGRSADFLEMSSKIAEAVDADTAQGITAQWWDESHLNRYLIDHPPAKVLTPAYAYAAPKYLVNPERWQTPGWEPKLLHLEKKEQGDWKDEKKCSTKIES